MTNEITMLPIISNPFNPSKDYVEELRKDELFEKDGIHGVLLRGLQRLAHNNRGGVLSVYSNIEHTPAIDNPIASVTVQYCFRDGTTFAGSADATTEAHKEPYSLHLVAVAESKAEARALRRAFNISRVSFEEIGSAPVAGGNTDNDPITAQTIKGITVVGKRKGLEPSEILKMSGRNITDLSELTQIEGRNLMKKLSTKKVK